ncbi:hypothetical protein GPALN_014788 [Globodera pallida]|nr:hypothetical protein GPALN_014788 [Globodera pallida]
MASTDMVLSNDTKIWFGKLNLHPFPDANGRRARERMGRATHQQFLRANSPFAFDKGFAGCLDEEEFLGAEFTIETLHAMQIVVVGQSNSRAGKFREWNVTVDNFEPCDHTEVKAKMADRVGKLATQKEQFDSRTTLSNGNAQTCLRPPIWGFERQNVSSFDELHNEKVWPPSDGGCSRGETKRIL